MLACCMAPRTQKKGLKDAKQDKSGIHDTAALVGVPHCFSGTEPNTSINLMKEAIVFGDKSEKVQDLLLLEVMPLPFGNDTIPYPEHSRHSYQAQTFTTYSDNQPGGLMTAGEA